MAGEGANAAAEAARAALDLSLSASSSGFSVSLKIDNTILAGILGVGALTLGAFYLANRRPVENAIRNSLEIIEETGITDPEVMSIETGSIIVELYCHTERSLLQFFEGFEAKKVKRRLKEEFTKIGFYEDVHVTIRNAGEMYNKVQEIRFLQEISKISVTALEEFEPVNILEVPDIQIDLLDLKDVYYKVQTKKLPTSEQRIAQGMVNGIVWTTGQIKNITAFVQLTPEAAKNVEDTIGPMKLKVTFKKIGVQSFRFSFDLDSVYKTPNKDEIVYKLGNIEVDDGNIWQLVIIVELIGALQRKFTSKGFHILRRKPIPTKHEAQGRNA